jgi:hypothetical protein
MAKFGRTLVSHDLCEHRIARQSRGVALAAANTVAIRAAPATVDRIPLMLAMLVATRRIKPVQAKSKPTMASIPLWLPPLLIACRSSRGSKIPQQAEG